MSSTEEAPPVDSMEPTLEEEAASLDGYFSDAPLDPRPDYPPLRETFDTAVVITNLPKAPVAKLERLTKLVNRLVSKIGTLATSNTSDPNNPFTGLQIPVNPSTNMTYGFAFVDYATPEDAGKALELLQDYAIDKNHKLSVTPYKRAIELAVLEDGEFKEPEPVKFVEKPSTQSWVMDPSQRDQFVIREGKETVVSWNDGRHEPVIDYDGEREKKAGVAWCEYYVQWSPLGSYLATMVPSKGVILWGGSKYEKMARFPSPGVEMVLFSPEENYMLTSNNNRNDPEAIKIFSVETRKLIRSLPLFPPKFLPDNLTDSELQQYTPPPFLWSHDDKYLARMGKDLISVYETPSLKLLEKRSLTATGIREFQFSPKANILAYWAPEHGNAPAHVDLIELPSRKKIRQKNLFNVTKCSMVWQNEGRFLGVKVTRHTKSKKTLYNYLELFRLEDSGVPVEMLDVKDAVMAFAWEPNGSRFAMIHAENPSSTKVNVSFYDMNKKATPDPNAKKGGKKKVDAGAIVAEVTKIETLEGRQCNCLFWSPAGQNIIMASLGDSASGALEFYDVDTKALMVKEHYRANQVAWDPAGRTVATIVSQPIGGGHFKFVMDNGYMLWTFQGKQISQKSYEAFYQLQWRPRKSLLNKTEVEKVIKNLKKYEKEFDKADKAIQRSRFLEETRGKRELRSEFHRRMERLKNYTLQNKPRKVELMNGYDSDDDGVYVVTESVIETILTTNEQII